MDIDRMKRARPALIRAAVAGLIALVGLIVAGSLTSRRGIFEGEFTTGDLIGVIGVGVWVVFGIAAIRALVNAIKATTADASGVAKGTPVSFIVALFGYGILLISMLAALGVNVGGLLLGGAFTGVVIGIAAQQTLGNFFAGIVLILMRPFTVGERVFIKGSPIGGEYEGLVTEMSLFYVHMLTATGPVQLPNAGVLASAIGPGARAQPDEEDETKEEPAPPRDGGPPAP
jgi:small-conductance mechanosensitive channel